MIYALKEKMQEALEQKSKIDRYEKDLRIFNEAINVSVRSDLQVKVTAEIGNGSAAVLNITGSDKILLREMYNKEYARRCDVLRNMERKLDKMLEDIHEMTKKEEHP
jgi:hypothetical protein